MNSILETVRSEKRTLLTEFESKQLLKQAGIPVVETRLARNREEAVKISREIGFPVAMKIVSPQIVHKSDIGGVKLNIKTANQSGKAFDDIMKAIKENAPVARIDGVTVQKMAKPGVEVIIGITRDAQFGPVMMFGLGGILVEIIKDVSLRVIPVELGDVREMIKEIKGYPLLLGYRGAKPVDMEKLENMLLKVSEFISGKPEIKELDLNPVIAYPDGVIAVDARIILEEKI